MCSASDDEVGGSAALNCRMQAEAGEHQLLALALDFTRGGGAYLAVVEVAGHGVGVSPEQSREQAERRRRRRRFRLQGALWFGGKTTSAPLQAVGAHHCEPEQKGTGG